MDSKNRIDWLKPRDKSSSVSAADGFAHSPNRLPIVHDCFLSQSVLRNMPNCSPHASQREPSSEANLFEKFTQRTWWCGKLHKLFLACKKTSEGKTDGEVERFKLIKFAPEVSVKFTHGRNSCANLYATRPPRACACPAIACNAPRLMRCWFSKMQNLHKSSCSYAKLCFEASLRTLVQHVLQPLCNMSPTQNWRHFSFFNSFPLALLMVKLNRNDVQVRWRIQGIDCQHSSWNLLAKPLQRKGFQNFQMMQKCIQVF